MNTNEVKNEVLEEALNEAQQISARDGLMIGAELSIAGLAAYGAFELGKKVYNRFIKPTVENLKSKRAAKKVEKQIDEAIEVVGNVVKTDEEE